MRAAMGLSLGLPAVPPARPNLVSNGSFDDGTTGWAGQRGGTIAVVDGELELTEGATITPRFSQGVALVAGGQYRLTGTNRVGTTESNVQFLVSENADLTSATAQTTSHGGAEPVVQTLDFTATADAMFVGGGITTGVEGDTAFFDDFSLVRIA